jgi:hypothetical protein
MRRKIIIYLLDQMISESDHVIMVKYGHYHGT